ncbi:PEP_CTERM-anchored TLD domain-containing protein [Janthinobacterium lividum]|uniref:PEP_CTERM-anchored TLD domain-containing protein n=1 Tax=Janthinobacterium lividum TaxID=29581 RepID=UPI001F107490|nr:PEP_CTERM-anchored TLD domain-containing protein [Janthinobacterium lividum]
MRKIIKSNIEKARPVLFCAGLLMYLGHAPAVFAQSLLDSASQAQLASWLGEGPLSLKAIYTKSVGDTSFDFHKASDGKGRTFSVMEARNESGQTWLVGGYNPQSWNSSGTYNMTPEDSQRTAFIFNLSTGQRHIQTPKSYALDSIGAYQTLNDINAGPTFGIGADLGVSADLTTKGVSYRYSYIDPDQGVFGISLLDGKPYSSHPNVTFGAIQVFSISAVPEPASYALMVLGLALIGGIQARKRHLDSHLA